MNNINKKFGRLILKEDLGIINGRHKYKCLCDCGVYKIVNYSDLTRKNVKSCGCLHHRKGKESPLFKGYEDIPMDCYSRIRRSSNRYGRQIEFAVSIEYLWNLFLKQNRKCALSGVPLEFHAYAGKNRYSKTSKITASLDRINNSKGYIEGNVHWVHKTINTMKNDMTVNEFCEWCKKIVDFNLM